MSETAALPLIGYVWEQDGRIIGNASLIPFRSKGKRIFLIANVATHPDYRRRGIGRALTERVMKQARDKNASAIWLHVRDDNPGAILLYRELGFQEIARRTTWQASPEHRLAFPDMALDIVPRHPRFWSLQQVWLERLYPHELSWYQSWILNSLRPGIWNWIYLLFIDFNVKQWAAVHKDELLATLTWMPQGGRAESLFAATGPTGASSEALTALLIHARRTITYPPYLTLEYPAAEMTEAIRAAGFNPRRTLLWMRA
jgi:predicted GNAT family acetyltransferase